MTANCPTCGQKTNENLPKMRGQIPVSFLISNEGLEYLEHIESKESIPHTFLMLRARYNTQRNLQVGIALISEESYKEIKSIFDPMKLKERILQEKNKLIF